MGRELQKIVGQPPQQIFLVPLLLGTDGSQKMSKSLDNYIGISEPPREMYGKVMSIPDHLILDYFELVTDVSDKELDELRGELRSQTVNPMILKKHLAYEIVAQFCGCQAAQDASEHFNRVFQRREMPEEIPPILFRVTETGAIHFLAPDGSLNTQLSSPLHPADILYTLGLVKSRREARRLIWEGAVEFDGERVTQGNYPIHNGTVIKVGKRHFVKLIEKTGG
jgi:tyrosyl-tRNA synthetase